MRGTAWVWNGAEEKLRANPNVEVLPSPGAVDFRSYLEKIERTGRFVVTAWHGTKALKPIVYASFRTRDAALAYLQSTADGLAYSAASKQKRRNERSAFRTTLKVGDILEASWGYDQTNYDFYQVVEVNGPQTVTIREIGADSRAEGWCRDALTPTKDFFLKDGKTKVCRVGPGESVKVRDWGVWASPYRGGERHATSYA